MNKVESLSDPCSSRSAVDSLQQDIPVLASVVSDTHPCFCFQVWRVVDPFFFFLKCKNKNSDETLRQPPLQHGYESFLRGRENENSAPLESSCNWRCADPVQECAHGLLMMRILRLKKQTKQQLLVTEMRIVRKIIMTSFLLLHQ